MRLKVQINIIIPITESQTCIVSLWKMCWDHVNSPHPTCNNRVFRVKRMGEGVSKQTHP